MNKKTTQEYSDWLGRVLQDEDSTNWVAQERLDYLNDAIEFLQTEIVAMNKRGIIADDNKPVLLPYENFSYINTITLPDDFNLPLGFRVVGVDGDDGKIHLVDVDDIGMDDTKQYGCIFASDITSPVADSGNAGTDDFQVRGDFSGSAETDYAVEIDGSGTFQWSNDGGSTWAGGTLVAITGDWQTLENGVQIKFESTTGYTIGDRWDFTATDEKEYNIFQTNWNPTVDVQGRYVRAHDEIAAIDSDTFIPYPRYYGAIRFFSLMMCRSRNEESFEIEGYVYEPTRKKVKEYILRFQANDNPTMKPGSDYRKYT